MATSMRDPGFIRPAIAEAIKAHRIALLEQPE